MAFRNFFLEQLQQLEQTSTIDEYHQRFEAIQDLVSFTQPGISNNYFAYMFINGLRADYHHYVQMFEPFTVIDAYELACIYEYSFCSFDNASIISIVSDGNNFGIPYDDIANTIEAKQMVKDTTELGEVDFHIEMPEQAPKEFLQNSMVAPIQSDAFEKEKEHRTALLVGDDIQCVEAYSPTVVNNSSPIFWDFLTSVALSIIVMEEGTIQNWVAPRDSASAIFLVNGLFSGEYSLISSKVSDPFGSKALVPPRNILLKNAVLSSGHTTIMGKGGTGWFCREFLASVNVVGNQFPLRNGSNFGTAAIDGDVTATSSIVALIVDARVINVELAASTHIPRPLILLIVRSPSQQQQNLHAASTGNVSIPSDRVTNMVVPTHASFVSELAGFLFHIIVAICVDLNGAPSDITVQLNASFGFKGGTGTAYISYFPELPCSSNYSFTTKECLLCSTIGTSTSIQISGFLHITIRAHMPTRAAGIEWDGVQICSGTMILSVTVPSSVLSDGFMCIAFAIFRMPYKAISILEATLQTMTSSHLKFVLVTNFVLKEAIICLMATPECILCFDLVIECDVLTKLDILFLSIGNMTIVFSNEHFHLALQGHPISQRTNCHGCVLRFIICFSPVLYWLTAEKTTWFPRDGYGIELFVYSSAYFIHFVTSSTIDTTTLVYQTRDAVSMHLVCTEQVLVGTEAEHHSYIIHPYLACFILSAHDLLYSTSFLISAAPCSYLCKDIFAGENINYVVQFYYRNSILDKGGTNASPTATSGVSAPLVKGFIASVSHNVDDTHSYVYAFGPTVMRNDLLLFLSEFFAATTIIFAMFHMVAAAHYSFVVLEDPGEFSTWVTPGNNIHYHITAKYVIQNEFSLAAQLTKLTAGVNGGCVQQLLGVILIKMSPSCNFFIELKLLQRHCNSTMNGVTILCSLSALSLLIKVASSRHTCGGHTWNSCRILASAVPGLLWSQVQISFNFALDLTATFYSLLVHNSKNLVAFLWIIDWLVGLVIWPSWYCDLAVVPGEHFGDVAVLILPLFGNIMHQLLVTRWT